MLLWPRHLRRDFRFVTGEDDPLGRRWPSSSPFGPRPLLLAVCCLAATTLPPAVRAQEGPSVPVPPIASAGMLRSPRDFDLVALERERVSRKAERYLREAPVTVTASRSERSAGGLHDFFSEGDYWWPDPASPRGPYVRRDGETNPANFVEHRRAMVRLSEIVGASTSAWLVTGDRRYAATARAHLLAWFVHPATRMSPHLLYAQAIHGRATGRATGLIDTLHLVEVARSARLLSEAKEKGGLDPGVRKWFAEYLAWMRTHPLGMEERDAKNNHATAWAVQVAAFADFLGDEGVLGETRMMFREVLLPSQMAPDGSFPLELARTKPYGYSLFNLDAFTTLAAILSTERENLFTFDAGQGRSLARGMAFLSPFIEDKSRWPYAKDVLHFDEWPVRQPCLLFGGIAVGERRYLDLFARLPADPENEEVRRNLPVRHPLLWVR